MAFLPDGPGAAVRAAAATASTQLAITLAAARRVLAALAADPAAMDMGPAVVDEEGGDGVAMETDRPGSPTEAATAAAAPPDEDAALRAALASAAADYTASSAALKAALCQLVEAEGAAAASPAPPDPARDAAAAALEAEVVPLRARVDAGNAGALDVASRLAALVEDLDAWRVDGIGRWTGGGGA